MTTAPPSAPRATSLAALLAQRGRLPPAQVAWLGMEVLGRLHAWHEAGWVAGRLPPAAILLAPTPGGRPSLRIEGGGPPEGGRVDPRGDVHACGALLYQALVGRPPFSAASPGPPSLEGIPEALAMVILQALEADPDDRFESAAEMAAVLAMAWPDRAPIPVDPAGSAAAVPEPQDAPEATPSVQVERTPGPAAHDAGVARTVLIARFSPVSDAPASQPAAGNVTRQTPHGVAREVIEAFDGRVISAGPAGVVATFASPTDCLQAGASIHDRLALLDAIHGPSVLVRAAVAVGEVAGNARLLTGAPVGQAELLVEVAAPGEVLFTHGVYLAMTRSEVDSEPWQGRDPGVAQRIHRLLPPQVVPRAALPFGGAFLGRRQGITPRRVATEAGRLADSGLRRTWQAGRRLLEKVGVERHHLVYAAGLVLAAALGAGAVWLSLPADPAEQVEEALARGDVARAEEVVDGWRREAPADVLAQAYQARALATAGRLEEAHAMLRQVLEGTPALARDQGVAQAIVRTLDRKGADRSLIMRHRSAAVDRALVEATRSSRNWERWNAVRALERLGKDDLIDRVGVHLLDLEHGTSCGTRIRAARALGELGDERAIAPLEQARTRRLPGWACNLDDAIDDALAAIAGLPPENEEEGAPLDAREEEPVDLAPPSEARPIPARLEDADGWAEETAIVDGAPPEDADAFVDDGQGLDDEADGLGPEEDGLDGEVDEFDDDLEGFGEEDLEVEGEWYEDDEVFDVP